MPAPSGVRLRDSCQSCAASKTRCSKEKPQCNRCAKRGTTCHYLVTQRTGRKAGPRSDSKEDINITTTQRPSVSRTPTPKSPSVRSSMERETQPELSVLTSRLDALEAAMLPSTSDCFSMLMADVDFSASVQPYDHSVDASDIATDYMMGVSHNGIHEMPYYSHEGLAAEGGADHDLPFRSGPSALPNSDLAPQDPPYSLPLPCDQLFQQLDHAHMHAMPQQQEGITLALQLMGQLCCLEQRPAYANLGPVEREHWINTLADKCRKVTSTVSDMLQCHSSEDGYFLAVVCLVMSKVLDAYVQAAQALSERGFDDRRLSHSSSSSTLSAMSTSESETSHTSSSPSAREGDAKAIQQLLDELYKVRASMDILGTKVASMSSSQDVLAAAIPFSPDVLNKLYEEQRKRLKTVSLQLINSLKAFWVEEHSF